MNLATTRAVIGADREKGCVNIESVSNIVKPIKIGRVARMVDGVLFSFENKTTEFLLRVVNVTGSPVVGGGEMNFGTSELERLPICHLVNFLHLQLANDLSDAARNDHRLVSVDNTFQCHPAEMIKMRMRDHHQIDRRKMFDIDPGIAMAFQRADPLRPDRIDQGVE